MESQHKLNCKWTQPLILAKIFSWWKFNAVKALHFCAMHWATHHWLSTGLVSDNHYLSTNTYAMTLLVMVLFCRSLFYILLTYPIQATTHAQHQTRMGGEWVTQYINYVKPNFLCDFNLWYCHNSDEKKLELVVQGPPDIVSALKTTDVKSRWVTLTWAEPRTGNSPILGYFVEFVLSNCK